MLLFINSISDLKSLDASQKSVQGPILISYDIIQSQPTAALLELLSQAKAAFIIDVDFSRKMDPEKCGKLLPLFLSHPFYYTEFLRPVVFFRATEEKNMHLVRAFYSDFFALSFKIILIPVYIFFKQTDFKERDYRVALFQHSYSVAELQKLVELATSNKRYYIIFSGDDWTKYKSYVEVANGLMLALNKKNEILLSKNETIANQEVFLDYLRNNNQEKNIIKFYHYEYEILPLWYKQLGHIIKVLIGKRTFKSLFNDNVKKYKD